jgi:hypothetical protein
MSDAGYFAGFLLMTLAVLTILTIGTLIASGVITFGDKAEVADVPVEVPGTDDEPRDRLAA